MKNVKFDVRSMTLMVSKKFMRQASIPFSCEYEMVKRILADFPNCRIEVRQTPHSYRQSYNPSYASMIACMEMQANAVELLEEFEKIRDCARISGKGYGFVRSWFVGKNLESNIFSEECILAA
ncbi:MAG: hypothetical protein J6K32_10370 [Clostridia bacterium]|nr:hypothetical protein [Clostridia bacterium]